jgi:hypothetical protein
MSGDEAEKYALVSQRKIVAAVLAYPWYKKS